MAKMETNLMVHQPKDVAEEIPKPKIKKKHPDHK